MSAVGGLLLTGASHAGKTTLARRVGDARGWRVQSTDALGRHPGRPWPEAPPAVEEFYRALSAEAIAWFHAVHHANMRPGLTRWIAEARAVGEGFVLEGSALRPSWMADVLDERLEGLCLVAEGSVLRDRIRAASDYGARSVYRRAIIDAFVERTQRDGDALRREAESVGIRCLDVADGATMEAVAMGSR